MFVAKTRMQFETGLLLGFSLPFCQTIYWHNLIFVVEEEIKAVRTQGMKRESTPALLQRTNYISEVESTSSVILNKTFDSFS